jgi:hypothetical protein
MKKLKLLVASGLALSIAGCTGVGTHYSADAPSPLYGGRPCPASASSAAGGEPTPWDCIPGGRETGGKW